MKWTTTRKSSNVEDHRVRKVPGKMKAAGGAGVLIMALIAMFAGKQSGGLGNLLKQIMGAQQASRASSNTPDAPRSPEEEKLAEFVAHVLGDTEEVWNDVFPQAGLGQYKEPKLRMFTGGTESGCGFANAAIGPFYCSADEKIYIDLSFYQDLKTKLGAPGDFAQAYVIAHEVGHHIQYLLGKSTWVHQQKSRIGELEYNKLSVRLELQADFYAGVWAHYAQRRGLLEVGDVDEALGAANAIGDDRLQKQARGHVQPDSFTHGTSAQRVRWFRNGLRTGDVRQGDTFKVSDSQL
jgi:predicted metalloprotease